MIKIFQAGQAKYAHDLIQAHLLRTKVFKERMKWDVHVTPDRLEFDQFDHAKTVYITVYDDKEALAGCCRLLPCSDNYMIKEIWPQYLNSIDIPNHYTSWELSRFAVASPNQSRSRSTHTVNAITAELFYAVTFFAMMLGIRNIYAMHDQSVERVVRKIGCIPFKTSAYISIDQKPCRVGAYRTDYQMLCNLLFQLHRNAPDINAESIMYENIRQQNLILARNIVSLEAFKQERHHA